MIAAARGLTEIVKTLLSHGADVTLEAAFGLPVYDVATGEAVIELLKKAQGPRKRLSPPPGTTALSVNKLMCDAAEKGNAGLVRVLIREEGADPNFRDSIQLTPLYHAIRGGDVATVETILSHGGNPNISVRLSESESPISYAKKMLKPDVAPRIIKALVDAGSYRESGEKTTPLPHTRPSCANGYRFDIIR